MSNSAARGTYRRAPFEGEQAVRMQQRPNSETGK
jgi:hypothetical protein